jgi:hypothetical protein
VICYTLVFQLLVFQLPSIFSRTKNQNSRILIDWCTNITFQLPIAKVIGASTTWALCKHRPK